MTGDISYNGNNLQTFNGSTGILVQSIDHRSTPDKAMAVTPLSHRNKSVIPSIFYPSRKVSISGKITGSSQADLDAREDAFKALFIYQDKNLDIGHAGGTRRYIATGQNIKIMRPDGLLDAGFQVDFICTDPWGHDTTATTLISDTNQTSASYAPSCSITNGNAPVQLPIFTYTLNNGTTNTTNLVTNPGFETDLTGYSSGGVGTASRVTTQNHSGAAAMQIVNAASAVSGNYAWELYFVSGLTAGQSYTFSVWLKGNAGGEIVKVGPTGAQKTVTLTTSWQQVFVTFTASSTSVELDFMSTSPASGTWFVDDVTVLLNSSTTLSIGNASTGQTIGITRALAAGDVVVIDCAAKSVQVNGVDVPYTGAFPEFKPGTNYVYYTDGLLTRNFNFSATLVPSYL